MKSSTIVVIGILGLAATPLALHLAGGSTTTTTNWIKKLHGGAATVVHGGSGVPKSSGVPAGSEVPAGSGVPVGSGVPKGSVVPTVPVVLRDTQDKKPAPKDAAPSLAGKWTVTIDGTQGSLVLTMVLKQEGKAITGTITSPHGEGTMPVVGQLVDRSLTLKVDAVTDHDEMHLAFKGAVKDDGSLAGTMTSAMGESKWTGTRGKDRD